MVYYFDVEKILKTNKKTCYKKNQIFYLTSIESFLCVITDCNQIFTILILF